MRLRTRNTNQLRTLGAAWVAAVTLLVAGCDQPKQAGETVGQRIDRSAESAAQRIDRMTDEAATRSREATSKAATAIDDSALTAKVKAALFAEPGLKTLQIEVETHEGVVTLAGSVDSPILRQRAVQIAGAMTGVRQVVDKLVVKA